MSIWVDGDACPKVVKAILFKAATRTQTMLWIVSNHFFHIPVSPFIKRKIVESGFDQADQYILSHLQKNDLLITSDIPLADAAISKKATVLNPRGKVYTVDNIKQILAARNLNETLRDSGLISGGSTQISKKEIQNFSNHLDHFLTR